MQRGSPARIVRAGLWLVALGLLPGASGQEEGAVRYTEVVDHVVRRTIELPGTVESRRSSVVASEVDGLVIELAVQPGHGVDAGQPLVRLRREYLDLQLRAARGRLKEAEARLQLAQSKLARARELFDDEVVSQEELDDAFSEFTAWQGRLDQTTAEIGSIELALDRSTVRAPYAGVVVAKRTEVGQWIERGGAVVELVALDDLQVQVDVPERYYGQLIAGAAIEVAFDALPDQTFGGELVEIIPRADPQARSFPAKVRLPNPKGRIGIGMLARIALPVGETFRAVLVPKDSVIRQGPDQSVFRINGDGVVEPVIVETGQGVGSWIVVRGELRPGEKVVTRGNERLRPGQPVHGEQLEYPLP